MSDPVLIAARDLLPPPRGSDGFATEEFLAELASGQQEIDEEAAARIERLCKKVEVPKRLLTGYSDDLNTSITDDPVDPAYAKYFMLMLFALAEQNEDLKYLNCALKLLDGVLILPVFEVDESSRRLGDSVAARMLREPV